MQDLLPKLADYITALERGASTTSRAEERPEYQRRLAATAAMFVALHQGDRARLRELIEQEEHGTGWGYLLGDAGAQAEAAFATFVTSARVSGGMSAA
jgi:hypothetical protein